MKAIFRYILLFSTALPLGAQNDQTHPELCGKPDAAVPLPPNLSVVIDQSETCPGKPDHLDSFGVFIEHAEIEPALAGDRLIHLSFRPTPGVCEPKDMELHSADFQPAKPEVHVPPKLFKAVEKTPPL